MEEIKNIADYLQVLLRYLISGVISVMVLGYLDDSCYILILNLFNKSPWIIVAITGIFGLLIYAVHQSLLDKFFYSLSIKLYLKRYKLTNALKQQILVWLKNTRLKDGKLEDKVNLIRNIRFGLFTQTYLRRGSSNFEIKSIQKEMDSKLALLNFLYCTFYSTLFISILLFYKYKFIDGHHLNNDIFIYHFHKIRFYGVLIASGILLISAFYLDYQITKREMWMVYAYFQNTCNDNSLAEFKIPKQSNETEAFFMSSFDNWKSLHSMMLQGNDWIYRTDLPITEVRYKYIIEGKEITNNPYDSCYWEAGSNLFKRSVKVY